MKEPAQDKSDMIEELKAKVLALTDENRLLKQRMDEAGISYADIIADNGGDATGLYDPDVVRICGFFLRKWFLPDWQEDLVLPCLKRGQNPLILNHSNTMTG